MMTATTNRHYVFGGYGLDSTGAYGYLDDVW
jgi:hypothetical protein